MIQCVEWGVANALTVAVLAPVVYFTGRWSGQPALRHGLWILLLVKLVTPPLIPVEVNSTLARTTLAWTTQLAANFVPASRAASVQEAAKDACVTTPSVATPGPLTRSVVADVEALTVVRRNGANSGQAPVASTLACSPTDRAADVRAVPLVSTTAPAWWSTLPVASLVRAIVGVWLIGAVSLGVVTVVRLVWFGRQLSRFGGRSEELENETAAIVRRLGRTRVPRTRLVRGVVSPMLFGVGPWTTLLFPEELFHKLSREARGTLLLHEIAHMCRGDHWVRPLECVATILYWWHPAVWWSIKEIESSEEECCDHWVMQRLDTPRRCYAEALMDTIDFLCERQAMLPPVASGLGNPRELRERLTRIMKGRTGNLIGLTGRAAIVLVVVGLPLQPSAFAGLAELFREGFATRDEAVVAFAEAGVKPVSLDRTSIRDLTTPSVSPVLNAPVLQKSPTSAAKAHREWGKSVSTDGRFEVARLNGGRVELRDRVSGRVEKLDGWNIAAVDFVTGESRFVSVGFDRQVRLWDAETGRMLRTYAERADAAVSIHSAETSPTFAVGTRGGELAIFRVDTLEPVAVKQFDGPVNCVRFSPAGDRLAAGLGDWREDGAGTGAVVILRASLDGSTQRIAVDRAVGSVGWTDRTNVIAAADWTGGVVYHDVSTGTRLAGIRIGKDQVSAASFAGHGATFPTLSVDDAVALERETAARKTFDLASGLLYPQPRTDR
jgi:bla regulator protein blaR1